MILGILIFFALLFVIVAIVKEAFRIAFSGGALLLIIIIVCLLL